MKKTLLAPRHQPIHPVIPKRPDEGADDDGGVFGEAAEEEQRFVHVESRYEQSNEA